MLDTFFSLAFKTFPRLKGVLWKQGYQFLSKFYKEKEWKFMNYGYCPGAENFCDLRLEEIDKSGLHLIKDTDITANVVEALRRDSSRKKAEITRKIAHTLKLDRTRRPSAIKKAVHKQLVRLILEFSGTAGSRIYNGFQNGNTVYLSFVLQQAKA
jgi:hypothetical protein